MQHHKYSHNQQHGQTQQDQTLRYTDGHDGDGAGMLGVDPAFAARVEAEIVQSCPNVSFADIAGLTFAKQTIRELIVYPLQRPDLFPVGLDGGHPTGGVLLFGSAMQCTPCDTLPNICINSFPQHTAVVPSQTFSERERESARARKRFHPSDCVLVHAIT